MIDEEARKAIASLNDVVAEIAAGLASGERVSRGYAFVVIKALSESSRSLGVEPSITPEQVAGWEGME